MKPVTLNRTCFNRVEHYDVAKRHFSASAWNDHGALSDPVYGVTIDDTSSRVAIESVEEVERARLCRRLSDAVPAARGARVPA